MTEMLNTFNFILPIVSRLPLAAEKGSQVSPAITRLSRQAQGR